MARVRPQRFVHIVYRTRRFQAVLDWYRRVFDARVQHQDPALAFLTCDDEHHRFAFANLDLLAPGAPDGVKGAVGVDHVAYTFASLDALLDHYEQLKAEGPAASFLPRREHLPVSPVRGALMPA